MAFNRGGFNRGGGFRRQSFGPREMHKITCSECGKEAEVPFKPTGDRPVFCRDCFMKRQGKTSNGFRPARKDKEVAEESEESEEAEEAKEEEL